MADMPGTEAFVTNKKYFCEVFSRPPEERGLGADAVSYEELRRLYHMGGRYRDHTGSYETPSHGRHRPRLTDRSDERHQHFPPWDDFQ